MLSLWILLPFSHLLFAGASRLPRLTICNDLMVFHHLLRDHGLWRLDHATGVLLVNLKGVDAIVQLWALDVPLVLLGDVECVRYHPCIVFCYISGVNI
jgi:hypothetical protein